MATPTKGRPKPAMNQDTEFFWAGTKEHKLLAQRCSSCKTVRHPPGPACPHCHSLDWEPIEIDGRGSLYSYTIPHHPLPPGFDTPPVVAVVELQEGVRLVTNLMDAEWEDLRIGDPLEVVFVDQEEGWTAPLFRKL